MVIRDVLPYLGARCLPPVPFGKKKDGEFRERGNEGEGDQRLVRVRVCGNAAGKSEGGSSNQNRVLLWGSIIKNRGGKRN